MVLVDQLVDLLVREIDAKNKAYNFIIKKGYLLNSTIPKMKLLIALG